MTAEYIKRLVETYPTIREVWLLGSRANGTEHDTSDWDYLIFSDQNILAPLTRDTTFNVENIDPLFVYGDRFMKPWPDGDRLKAGSLSGWQWKQNSDGTATYRATKLRDGDEFSVESIDNLSSIAKAIRIY